MTLWGGAAAAVPQMRWGLPAAKAESLRLPAVFDEFVGLHVRVTAAGVTAPCCACT